LPFVAHPRRKYNKGQGSNPKKGWLKENDWVGDKFIPLEELPHLMNPESGFLTNGNNRLTTDNVQHGVSSVMSMPHRKLRLDELL
jgi:penicillin amidase